MEELAGRSDERLGGRRVGQDVMGHVEVTSDVRAGQEAIEEETGLGLGIDVGGEPLPRLLPIPALKSRGMRGEESG